MGTRPMRALLALGGLVVVVGMLAILLAPDPVTVDGGRIARGSMRVTVSSEGKTRLKDLYELAAPVAGRLMRSGLKAGDRVVASDTVVATIVPAQPQFHDARSSAELEAKARAAEAQRAVAEADLERAKAELEFARAEIVRKRSLSETGAESTRGLQQSERDLKIRAAALVLAEKALAQRTSELELAKASLMAPTADEPNESQPWIDVRSPVSGRVLNVLRESETIVTPGMPLLQIGDPAKLEVMLEMLSEDAVKVREGAAAELEGWGGELLNGRVRRVEPSGFTKISALGIEEQRVRVLLDFTDAPALWQTLGHGYRINARIVVWERADVLKLPVGALFRDGDGWAAYVIRDGAAELRQLLVGQMNDREAEILRGVSDGEQAILHPSDRIGSGVPVRLRASTASGSSEPPAGG